MKSYYQISKGGFKLKPPVYAKTVKEIACYRYFEETVKKINQKELQEKLTEKDIYKRATAKLYIKTIEKALNCIPVKYQKAIFEHLVDRSEYTYLEQKYFVSASTMKRYTQLFVWKVATELDEDF